jgi:hypothetical protein
MTALLDARPRQHAVAISRDDAGPKRSASLTPCPGPPSLPPTPVVLLEYVGRR